MEVVHSSETSASIYQTTQRNIPEDSHLHTVIVFRNSGFICFLVLFKNVEIVISYSIFLYWNSANKET
jgi:hypothetical protein